MAEDDLYELVEPRKTTPDKAGDSAVAGKPPRVVQYRTPATEPRRGLIPARTLNVQIPIYLLAGAVAARTAFALVFRSGGVSAEQALMKLGMEMLVMTGVLFVAMQIAARFREIDLGSAPIALLKIAAIAVASRVLEPFLGPVSRLIPVVGGLLLIVAEILLAIALIGALFELDESDARYCVLIAMVFGIAGALVVSWMQ